MLDETGEELHPKSDVYYTAFPLSDITENDVSSGSRVRYAKAGVKSAFEKYGLFTLFFARKR